MSNFAFVVISPVTSTNPVQLAVSQATRLIGSSAIHASRIASEIASHILSGCPSVTDSDVNNLFSIVFSSRFVDSLIKYLVDALGSSFFQTFFRCSRKIKKTAYIISGPDNGKDNQILLLFDLLAQVGTFLMLWGCRDFIDPMYLHHSE